jgi:hypothetical protein
MPGPSWFEAWDAMYSGWDEQALPVVKLAITASRSDCRNETSDFRTVRGWEEAITAHNANRWTLLHLAASNNHLQCAAALIKSGGQPALRKTTHAGSTPLHMAAREGHLEMCVLLCDNGASLKATNNCGRTPLLEACQFQHQNSGANGVGGVIGFLRKRAIERKLERDATRAQMKRDKNRSDDDGDVENIPAYAKAESGAGGEVGEAQKQGDDETVGDLTDDGSEIF